MDASTDPTWPRLVDEVRQAFAGSPYRVEASTDRIVVQADLADARFLSLGGARAVRHVFRTELRPKDAGRVTWTDAVEEVEWTAGVDGALRPRLSGRVRVVRGRAVGGAFRTEVGIGADGPGAPVDYRFTTFEISRPLEAAMARAGVRRAMAGATKAGLVAAIVGGVGGLAGGVAAILIGLGVVTPT